MNKKCHYPECMLCCCEDGRDCMQVESTRPRNALLKGIAAGLLFVIAILLITFFLIQIWPNK